MWDLIAYWIIFTFIALKFFSELTKGYCDSNVCLDGKTAIVTGGNSGMGYEMVLNLASRGCQVIIADVVDANATVKKAIKVTGNARIEYMQLNLASLQSVRQFANAIIASQDRLDILINNAGCAGFNAQTPDGLYKVFQINYLGHFLLTNLLSPLLIKTKHSRVVFVSSLLAYTHNLCSGLDININADYKNSLFNSIINYGNSKVCLLAATESFAKRFAKHGTIVTSCHPGVVKTKIYQVSFQNTHSEKLYDTIFYNLIYLIVKCYGKTPTEGIQSALHGALSRNVTSGAYYIDCVAFRKPTIVYNKQFCEEVWQESVRLSGLSKEEQVEKIL